jgi:hypothetical protein
LHPRQIQHLHVTVPPVGARDSGVPHQVIWHAHTAADPNPTRQSHGQALVCPSLSIFRPLSTNLEWRGAGGQHVEELRHGTARQLGAH